MKIFDSRTEKFVDLPQDERKLQLFVCGPTVYDNIHIGNARTYISFDMIARVLRWSGHKVYYLQNITDVDDKIITRAHEYNSSPFKTAKLYEDAYHTIEKKLNITSVTTYARASHYIDEIIRQIQVLIDKEFAYETPDGIYFEVRKFKSYGGLSKQNLDALRPGYRIEPDTQKKDPLDFALWKKSHSHDEIKPKKHPFLKPSPIVINGDPAWHSPWGWGRPGWHIEDTAITEKFFGPQYDIHGGGVDIKFPHHESEIAQQEAASGKHPLVKVWMHAGTLLVEGVKMSKSLGNFITAEDMLSKYSPNVFRYMVLSVIYRSPFNFTDELAQAAKNGFGAFEQYLRKIDFILSTKRTSLSEKTLDIAAHEEAFRNALQNDFNTPEAFAALHILMNEAEGMLFTLSSKELKSIRTWIYDSLELLGFKNFAQEASIPSSVRKLAQQRQDARTNKQFMHADALRSEIHKVGYGIDDTPLGQFIYPLV